MSFWSWITGGGKAVEAAADIATDISSGIDKIFYTDEEKADARQKGYESWLELMRIEKDATSIRAITRRIIACIVVAQWFIATNLILFMETFMDGVSKQVMDLYTDVTKAFLMVMAFYFSKYLLDMFKKK